MDSKGIDEQVPTGYSKTLKHGGLGNVDGGDSKARLAMDTWRTRFFTLLNDVKKAMLKKKDILAASPWLWEEIDTGSGGAFLKKQTNLNRLSKDIDSDGLDLESIDPNADKTTTRCSFSRIQVYIYSLFRQLSEHMNIIEKFLLTLNNASQSFESLPSSTDHQKLYDKNPIYRALYRMDHSERDTLVRYCTEQIHSAQEDNRKIDTKEEIVSAKKSSTKDKKMAPVPEPSAKPLLPLHQVVVMGSGQEKSFSPKRKPDSEDLSDSNQNLLVLKSGAKRIDTQLEEISHGVTHLKVIAKDIEEEVDRQNQTIPEISNRVEDVENQLEATDKKVRKALRKLQRSRWPWYVLLCVILCVEIVFIFRITVFGTANGYKWKKS